MTESTTLPIVERAAEALAAYFEAPEKPGVQKTWREAVHVTLQATREAFNVDMYTAAIAELNRKRTTPDFNAYRRAYRAMMDAAVGMKPR